MTAAPPLVLDAGSLFDPQEDERSRDLACVLAGEPSFWTGMIRCGRHGIESVPAECRLPARPAAAEAQAAVRRWLLGQGPRPPEPSPSRGSSGAGLPWRRRPVPELPRDAVIVKAGLRGWDDAAWRGWLDARPDQKVIALLDLPVAMDWPEYASRADVAALPGRLDAVAMRADAVVVPDETAKAALAGRLTRPAQETPRLVVQPFDVRDDPEPAGYEPDLAAAPFFIVADRIEARANTALLLHIWRDLIRTGARVPRLILAGERGRQIEEIRPLLSWNHAIAAEVAEAPDLRGPALRHMAAHARAVLAPAFAGGAGALLRELGGLGVPVIASDIPAHAEALGRAELLDPLDGPAWRARILAASGTHRPPPGPRPRPDRRVSLDRLVRLAASL